MKAQISELEKQLQKFKEEIALLRLNEARMTKELEETLDERDQYKRETKTLKQVNRAIEKDFRAVGTFFRFSTNKSLFRLI